MILKTIEELRMYLPSHNLSNMDSIYGYIENSEQDFLLERIGRPLMKELQKKYDEIEDKTEFLPNSGVARTAWQELIVLCQRVVAYNCMARSADITAVSINSAGINVASTSDYDAAKDEAVKRFKQNCNIEAHSAVNRLLVQLEEWAQDCGKEPADDKQEDTLQEEREIVELWKKSRYYYLVNGLFINTASMFNQYVDIYDNREKFVQLLPDLRLVQDLNIRPELGDELTDDLLDNYQNGTLNDHQNEAVKRIQRTMALFVESRNSMFKRPQAKDEALMNMKVTIDYISGHASDFGDAVKSAPFYEEPKPAEENSPTEETPGTDNEPGAIILPQKEAKRPTDWKNNREGNVMFVVPGIV